MITPNTDRAAMTRERWKRKAMLNRALWARFMNVVDGLAITQRDNAAWHDTARYRRHLLAKWMRLHPEIRPRNPRDRVLDDLRIIGLMKGAQPCVGT